jgi:GLPGLI family protein
MKEIGGHICMNAETTDKMRDQTINAWFALDIPVSSGPERFIGLPGMILEVDINDGAVIMTADKIDLKKLTSELDIPAKIKGRKIHYADLENIFLKKIDESKKNEEPWFFWLPY